MVSFIENIFNLENRSGKRAVWSYTGRHTKEQVYKINCYTELEAKEYGWDIYFRNPMGERTTLAVKFSTGDSIFVKLRRRFTMVGRKDEDKF